jgi:hypothetical protein
MKHSVRDVGVAGSNPATPPIRFTKQFNRLVNFLNLCMNIKKSPLGNACVGAWSIAARRGSRMGRC